MASEQQELGAAADEYEAHLRDTLGADEQSDLDTLRPELRERLRQHERWQSQREQWRLDRDKLTVQHQEAVNDESRLTLNQRQAERTWKDLREQMRLPDAWTPEVIASHLSDLNAAKSAWTRIGELRQKIEELSRESDSFRDRVLRLAGGDDQDRTAIERLHQLSQQLAEAQASKQKLSATQQEDHRLQQELASLKKEREDAETRWGELKRAAGAESDESFLAALEGASIHQQLQAAMAQVHAALGCDDTARRATLLAELEKSSESQLQQRLHTAKANLKDLERQRSQLHKEEGATREQLKQLDASDAAARVEMQRQSTLAELSEQVDQWAPLTLAASLMDQALQRFERKHQPELLNDVAELFRRMTGGVYVDVKRQLGKSKSLVVLDGDSREKTPAQLSTGAREQLYLAIRLAYVRMYCQRSEPLPLVMDDVLVNFDEARAKRTIDVLVELSDEVQVLMMTCHRRTAKLIHESCPGMHPILLSNDPGRNARPLGFRTALKAQAATTRQTDGRLSDSRPAVFMRARAGMPLMTCLFLPRERQFGQRLEMAVRMAIHK